MSDLAFRIQEIAELPCPDRARFDACRIAPLPRPLDTKGALFDNATDNMVAVLRLNPSSLTVSFVDTTGATVAGSTFRFPILI